MPTSIKENYLKALHYLSLQSSEISVTELGNAMDVSKPTVNVMVKNLASKGWVVHEKYQPIRLTPEGKRAAAKVIRKHRLAELFLYQVMGFGWEEVHAIAEELEHVKSEYFFQRMDEMLGQPLFDPHGSPIPDASGHMPSTHYILLSQVAVPCKVVVKAIADSSPEFLIYLNEKNIQLGTELALIHKEAFDGNLTVSFNHCDTAILSQSVASRLLVDSVSEPTKSKKHR